jgi:hypothetical protein
MINFDVMGEQAFTKAVTRPEAAKAGGGDLAAPASGVNKDETMRVIAVGLAMVVRRLFDDGRPGCLNWRPALAALAFLLSLMDAVEIIERR